MTFKEHGAILVTSLQMAQHSWTPRGQCPQQLTTFQILTLSPQSGTIWSCLLIIYKPSPVSYPMLPCAVTALVWSWDNVRTAAETSGSASSFTRVQLSDGLLHMLRAPLSSVQVWEHRLCENPTPKQKFVSLHFNFSDILKESQPDYDTYLWLVV